MRQARLPFGPMDEAEAVYQRVLRRLEEVAAARGKGEVAGALGMGFPTFSNALRDRNRSRFDAVELIAQMVLDDTGTIIAELAEALGFDRVQRKRKLTPEQKLARAEERMRRRLGDRVTEEILGEGVED
jgi:hypothetical protein